MEKFFSERSYDQQPAAVGVLAEFTEINDSGFVGILELLHERRHIGVSAAKTVGDIMKAL